MGKDVNTHPEDQLQDESTAFHSSDECADNMQWQNEDRFPDSTPFNPYINLSEQNLRESNAGMQNSFPSPQSTSRLTTRSIAGSESRDKLCSTKTSTFHQTRTDPTVLARK